jgi:hypothetical protein
VMAPLKLAVGTPRSSEGRADRVSAVLGLPLLGVVREGLSKGGLGCVGEGLPESQDS